MATEIRNQKYTNPDNLHISAKPGLILFLCWNFVFSAPSIVQAHIKHSIHLNSPPLLHKPQLLQLHIYYSLWKMRTSKKGKSFTLLYLLHEERKPHHCLLAVSLLPWAPLC